MPEIGDAAPGFTLRETSDASVSLSEFRGRRNVLLVFHPFSFTGTSESEMCELRDHADRYDDHDTEIVSVSCDAWPIRQAWKRAIEGRGRYLSDFWPHGEASRAYGVFDEKRGAPERATFLIDKQGVVRYKVVLDFDGRRDEGEYLSAVANLG
jgi:mycoredoxin-dependent peroxiredoxin